MSAQNQVALPPKNGTVMKEARVPSIEVGQWPPASSLFAGCTFPLMRLVMTMFVSVASSWSVIISIQDY
jgi:hypothetical protein